MNWPRGGRHRAIRIATISIMVLIVLNQIIPTIWFSPEIRARIVTPDRQPVAGAIVVANWNITASMTGGSLGQLALVEVVTDKDGWLKIPQWGPRATWQGTLSESEPTIRIFRRGFSPLVVQNSAGIPMDPASRIINFRLQNREITLKPFHGSLAQYEHEFIALNQSMDMMFFSVWRPGRCIWKKMPRLLIEIQRIKDEMAKIGVGDSLRSLNEYVVRDQDNCGNAEQFLREYRR